MFIKLTNIKVYVHKIIRNFTYRTFTVSLCQVQKFIYTIQSAVFQLHFGSNEIVYSEPERNRMDIRMSKFSNSTSIAVMASIT